MNPDTLKQLKRRAHALKVVVMLGNKGLTQAVQAEIAAALIAHELIKIKISAPDSASKQDIIQTIVKFHNATLIQTIGNVCVIYKKSQA